jgi:hypothetical protein
MGHGITRDDNRGDPLLLDQAKAANLRSRPTSPSADGGDVSTRCELTCAYRAASIR